MLEEVTNLIGAEVPHLRHFGHRVVTLGGGYILLLRYGSQALAERSGGPESVVTCMAGFEGSGSMVTPLAGFAGARRPHPPGRRTATPAAFR